MAAKDKATTQEQAFEMIELAIDDLELLTRAFNVIKDACDEVRSGELISEEDSEEALAESLTLH